MSSLAATQADGFYHPPEYDPTKHGSVSKFHGSNGHNQFLKKGVVRIEMPYKAWCLNPKCGRVIGQGTRFNARKKEVGEYFTTKIYEFTFCCASCDQPFVMRTNPQLSDYDFIVGLRKFDDKRTTEDDTQVLQFIDDEGKEKIDRDSMFALESESKKQQRLISTSEAVRELVRVNDAVYKDDFITNRSLRSRNRKLRLKEENSNQDSKRLKVNFNLIEESTSSKENDTIMFQSQRKLNKEKTNLRKHIHRKSKIPDTVIVRKKSKPKQKLLVSYDSD